MLRNLHICVTILAFHRVTLQLISNINQVIVFRTQFDDPVSFKGCHYVFLCFLELVVSVKITYPFLRLRRLAAETDEALKEQDERLGKILGKLQVSLVSNCHCLTFLLV